MFQKPTDRDRFLDEILHLINNFGADSEEAGALLYATIADHPDWGRDAHDLIRHRRSLEIENTPVQENPKKTQRSSSKDKAILKIRLSDENDARIGRICANMNVGPGRAILFAIELLEILLDAKGDNKRVVIIDDEAKEEVEVIFENREQPASKE